VAERSDGSLLINARNHMARSGGQPELARQRMIATSSDGGLHWSEMTFDKALIEPTCQASLVRYSYRRGERREWMLFANPASQAGREKMTVRLSLDDGRTWPHSRLLYEGSSAYSCLAVLPDGQVGIVYECDSYRRITFSLLSIDDLRQ
jgi:sialidase-1